MKRGRECFRHRQRFSDFGVIGYYCRFQNISWTILSPSILIARIRRDEWVNLSDNIYWANSVLFLSSKPFFYSYIIYVVNRETHIILLLKRLFQQRCLLISCLYSPKFYCGMVIFFYSNQMFVEIISSILRCDWKQSCVVRSLCSIKY